MTHQSINVKPSGKVSVKSPMDNFSSKLPKETSIVDVSKVVGISVGSPIKEITLGGKIKGYFGGETPLMLIGIMVGIISLAVSLWSMHKNSVLTKRLTEINSSIVDIIVETKKENAEKTRSIPSSSTGRNTSMTSFSTVVSKQTPVSQAQAIRERLREKRSANAESRLILEEQSRKVDELRNEQSKVLQRLELEATENRKMLERNQASNLVEANKSLKELRERKHKKPTPVMQTDPRKLFPEPHNPVSTILGNIIPKNLGNFTPNTQPVIQGLQPLKDFVDKATEEENVEIDIDDLERDLMFLKG